MFTIIGIIIAFLGLVFFTLASWFMLFHGGEEFSAPKGWDLAGALVFASIVGFGWHYFFSSVSITVT